MSCFIRPAQRTCLGISGFMRTYRPKQVTWPGSVILRSQYACAGVSAIKRWSGLESGRLGDEDLVISADVDEVLSQDALHHLRNCHLTAPVISGAIIMPFGNLDMAFRSALMCYLLNWNTVSRSDFPVEGKPHSYALPTIYSWSVIKSGQADGEGLIVHILMTS